MPTTQLTGSPWQTTWTTAGANIDTVIAALGVGDKLVVNAMAESNSSIATPSNVAGTTPATITWTLKSSVNVASRCWAGCWEGAVTGAGNATIRLPPPATGFHGCIIWGFPASGHNGLGAVPAGTNGTAAGPTLTATWTAGSIVCCLDGDFAAGVTTGKTYRTGNGTPTERAAINTDGNYTIYAFEYPASVGGSQAVGLSAPTQTYSLVALEVLAPAATAEVLVNMGPMAAGGS